MCKAKSVDEFLKMIFEKIRIANEKDDDPFNLYWFRGESCDYKETSLTPGAYRDSVKKSNQEIIERSHTATGDEKLYASIEINVKADFDRQALRYIYAKNIENTAWNRYLLMQHYNVRTRLLDWTEDAIKALYLALNKNPGEDAKVWILRPYNLNNFTIGKLGDKRENISVIPHTSHNIGNQQDLFYENGDIRIKELTRRYLLMDFYREKKDYYPLAIYPPFLDERMAAQKTCFTIFGDENDDGLHEVIKFQNKNTTEHWIIDSITIDGKSKEKMRKELLYIGIDESSVYPDLDRVGESIDNKFKEMYKKPSTAAKFFRFLESKK